MFNTLSEFIKAIPDDIQNLQKDYPILAESSEAVNQAFRAYETAAQIERDDKRMVVLAFLRFGAHSSWVDASLLMTSGHESAGWTSLRRAIEFTLYAAKIVKSDKLAETWVDQARDEKALKKFKNAFKIPDGYNSAKYLHLRDLLLVYDHSNYYGAHANFETFVHQWAETTENSLKFQYTTNAEIRYLLSSLTNFVGYRTLTIFNTLASSIYPTFNIDNQMHMSYVYESIKRLTEDLEKHEYKSNNLALLVKDILSGDKQRIEARYKNYIDAEEGRKNS